MTLTMTAADPDETFAHWASLYLNAKGFDLGTLRQRLRGNGDLDESFRTGLDRARARTSMDPETFGDLTAMDFDSDAELEDFLAQVHGYLYGATASV